MNNLLKYICLLAFFASTQLTAQNVSISTDGSPADPSAMLDIQSSERGLLIPRMSTSERELIEAPAKGLLVFDNDFNNFWYFENGWKELSTGQTPQTLSIAGTQISISNGNSIQLPDFNTSSIQDFDGDTRIETEHVLNENVIRLYVEDSTNPSFIIRKDRLEFVGDNNLFIGKDAGMNHQGSTGQNVCIGESAGAGINTTGFNTMIGFESGQKAEGEGNTFLGNQSGTALISGGGNTFIGDVAMKNAESGTANVAVGAGAGSGVSNGSGNVFLGYLAGAAETGSNRLYIENGTNSFPLIYGEFDSQYLQMNARISVNGMYILPEFDGTEGQVIYTDGAGQLNWTDVGGAFSLENNVVSNTGDQAQDDFVFGAPGTESSGDADHETRVIFDKSSGAFRAGYASGDQWDEDNRGNYSVAFGANNKVSGSSSFLSGNNSEASEQFNFGAGSHLSLSTDYGTAFGKFNVGGGHPIFWQEDDPIFEIGCGTIDQRENLFTILKGGKVVIGKTATPALEGLGYDLVVDGKMLCEEVRVQDSGNWPDFVFADEYELRSLKEVKSFIAANNHLPDVPSAAEVNGNGFELAEMNEILLRKIEELTLYVIQLEEKVNNLSNQE